MATVIVTKCASIDLGEVRVLGQDVTAAAADYVLTASAEISAASLSLMWKYKDDGTGPEDDGWADPVPLAPESRPAARPEEAAGSGCLVPVA